MKLAILVCLLATAAAAGNLSNGSAIEGEPPVELNQCPAYDDVNHFVMFAYPEDCRKYYSCLNGVAYVHQCPDNLYWSQLTYRCDYKQYSTCETHDLPEQVWYSAYPGDCTRYYETRVLQCPYNNHWSEQYQRCDLPQVAGCRGYSFPELPPTSSPPPLVVPTAATPPPPVVPTAATPPNAPQATAIPPEYTEPFDPEYLCKSATKMAYLAYPGDCHKFIHCGPTVSVLSCPAGLYWNRSTQSCGSSASGCHFEKP